MLKEKALIKEKAMKLMEKRGKRLARRKVLIFPYLRYKMFLKKVKFIQES